MVELLLLAPGDRAEAISDALAGELGALAVSLDDAEADGPHERAIYGEPGFDVCGAAWPTSAIKALYDDEDGATRAAALLLASEAGVRLVAIRRVEEQDWVRLTQSQFAPVEVAASFWVVPSWHEPPADAQRVIRLDPGRAFGTGTHATTRMCLRWIARHADRVRARRVLDYGCGSGILAIGAALHGAAEVDAVDLDPEAVEATRDNAAANGVRVAAGPPEAANGRYGVVLANILAAPLRLLAPLLCGRLEAGGDLVLAGILERQADELKAAYAPWLAIDTVDADDGWVLMAGRRA